MATLVRVLILLACGPMLVPPGFCVCKTKAGEPTGTVPHRPLAPTSASPSHTSDRCSHRHATTDASSDSVPAEQPAPDHAPTPHDDHAPGCPAGVEQPQRVEPTADAGLVADLPAFVGVSVLPVTNGCRPPDRPALSGSSPPPLYLTHCSLVI